MQLAHSLHNTSTSKETSSDSLRTWHSRPMIIHLDPRELWHPKCGIPKFHLFFLWLTNKSHRFSQPSSIDPQHDHCVFPSQFLFSSCSLAAWFDDRLQSGQVRLIRTKTVANDWIGQWPGWSRMHVSNKYCHWSIVIVVDWIALLYICAKHIQENLVIWTELQNHGCRNRLKMHRPARVARSHFCQLLYLYLHIGLHQTQDSKLSQYMHSKISNAKTSACIYTCEKWGQSSIWFGESEACNLCNNFWILTQGYCSTSSH